MLLMTSHYHLGETGYLYLLWMWKINKIVTYNHHKASLLDLAVGLILEIVLRVYKPIVVSNFKYGFR